MPEPVYGARGTDPAAQLHLTTFPPRSESRRRLTDEQLDEFSRLLIPWLDDRAWRWREQLWNSVPKPR